MSVNDESSKTAAPAAGAEPAEAVTGRDANSQPDESGARTRRGPGRLVLPLLLIVLVAAGIVGYRYWQEQRLYVTTENAVVSGALLQVGTLNAGRVLNVRVDIGDQVTTDQVVARITAPTMLVTTYNGTQKMGFRDTDDQALSVQSPIDGIVVARSANPGDTVAAGSSIVTVVDPRNLWVVAEIEETKIGRVHLGAAVEVTVDSLGKTLKGRVAAINSATAATFSLIPSTTASGSYTKETQLVPVKIAVDYGDLPLVLGSSVEVKIWAQG